MGNLAGKVARRAMRPFKNFAVEARTERILAKEKPTPAPWHPSTQKTIDKLMQEGNYNVEEQSKKDVGLDDRLKKVFVTSQDQSLLKGSAEKPLPVERKVVVEPEFGYQEPAVISKGKLSLRQALILIARHKQDPTVYNIQSLSKEYTVHPKNIENILKHFSPFEVYVPPDAQVKLDVKDYVSLKSLPSQKEGTSPQISDGGIKT